MRSKVAAFVLSIASGLLCLGGAFTLTGCGSSGTTTGGTQPQSQTITFNQPTSPSSYGSTVSLVATGGASGNQVTFTVDPSSTGKGTIASGASTVSLTGVGTVVIDANQAGNSSYSAAPQVQRQITVTEASPTVSAWPTASALASGQALSSSVLTGGTASVPGTFTWTTPSTIPPAGTDSEGVTFTPTDATDYQVVNGSVPVVVNPTTPQITNATPRYVAADNFTFFVPYVFPCAGCQNGDIVHDASGLFTQDVTLSLASGATSFGLTLQWEQGYFQPWFNTWEVQHPNGPYGNQWSTAFLGSAAQSTLVASKTTGTLFQVVQATGQVNYVTTGGVTGTLLSSGNGKPQSPIQIAADDVSGNIAYLFTGQNDIAVFSQNGTRVCDVTLGMSFASSIAAQGGYMVFTDPVDNLVGIAKMADCSGYHTIAIAGQPWAVAMVNGAELDAYIISRDKWDANGLPGLSKLNVSTGTIESSVELSGIPPVSTVRATAATQYEGVYQVTAFNKTPVAEVLFMSDPTDGVVLTINTSTMAVTHNTPITDLPFGITSQETASSSTLWVAYISASNGEAVTHIGALDPTTGNYTPAVGACQTGILAGGFVATAQGVYCAQGSVIDSPLVLQP